MRIAFLAGFAAAAAQFLNTKVEQDVDLTASYARQTVNVWAENIGKSDAETYLVPLSDAQWETLILFEAQSLSGMNLAVERLEDQRAFAVEMLAPTPPGDKVQFAYAMAFEDAIRTLPEYAGQNDPQKLVYQGSKLVYSAYESKEQTTVVKTVTTKVKDLATGQEASVDNKVGGIQFGPVKNVPAKSVKELRLHYENPLPQVRFTECNRTIWISHWSDAVSFDERYDIYNAGTKLDKPFSRLDFMTAGKLGKPSLSSSAIRSVRIPTGPKARDTYYVDLVGNISTSTVTEGFMDVALRFPLFGGWRTEFTVGWSGLISSYVQSLGKNLYAMQVPLVRGPEGAQFDVVENTVILPEGASKLQVFSEEADSISYDTVYSYLDLFGRPSVTLIFKKLVGEHQRHTFTVVYEYSVLTALKKPIAYSAMVFGLFVLAHISRNVDLSIKKKLKTL